jgi:mono/diheme cytochrome c family protein
MRADRVIAGILMLTAVLSLAGTPREPRAKRLTSPALPPGEGRAIAERACVICHSRMLIVQQAKDSTAWEKTLGTMQKWGAPLTPAEHDSLVRYLVTTLGPRAAQGPR